MSRRAHVLPHIVATTVVGLLLVGCGVGPRDHAPEGSRTKECSPFGEPHPEFTTERPMGVVGPDCKLLPYRGATWSVDVPCTKMWQAGKRLPAVYRGCSTPDGESPMHIARSCEDPDLESAWVYGTLAAHSGQVIREAAVVVTASGVVTC